MKTQLRKLNLIFKLTEISEEMLFVISTWEDEISAQGKFNTNTVRALVRLKFAQSINDSGMITFKRNKVTITLS
jgi:hypothetical protein